MKMYSVLAQAVLFIVVAGCVRYSHADEVELFNGKNLDGWIPFLTTDEVPPDSVWTVSDGILTCKGEPLGYLHSKDSFKNFKLVVEYRWAPGTKPGNNGIFSRIQEPTSGPIPRCVETQLNATEAGDKLKGPGGVFWPGLVQGPSYRSLRPPVDQTAVYNPTDACRARR